MKNLTIDKALIFSAAVLLIYSIITEIQVFMGVVPNDTLTACVFVAFGVAEGGYCTFIHHLKKKKEGTNDEDNDSSDFIDD